MINFTYRGFTGRGELIEETSVAYIIGFEGDQRTYPKELTELTEVYSPNSSFSLEHYETLVYKGDTPYAVHHITLSGQIRKNGKIMVWRKL